MAKANYSGLGKRVRVRSGYYYTPTYPWDNYRISREGYCVSAPHIEMCIEFEDGSQEWFPVEDITFLE